MSLNTDLLTKLADIYTFVKSRELTKSIQTYTLAYYLEQAKENIKSDKEKDRPTKIERLKQLGDNISNTISEAKKTDVDKSTDEESSNESS